MYCVAHGIGKSEISDRTSNNFGKEIEYGVVGMKDKQEIRLANPSIARIMGLLNHRNLQVQCAAAEALNSIFRNTDRVVRTVRNYGSSL